MKKICVLTGAGISAESGLRTFRGAGGLWEGHDIMEVATPEGWAANRELVLEFYNQRRRQLKSVSPNQAHYDLVRLEENFQTVIITQNVDDLHEKAGSTDIIHLHGELLKVRSCDYPSLIYQWEKDLQLGDLCEMGSQLRPHIVWFGEDVPLLQKAVREVENTDFVVIVGTSMQVYPAAMLTAYAPANTPILYIDPDPQINYELSRASHLQLYKGPATKKVAEAIDDLFRWS